MLHFRNFKFKAFKTYDRKHDLCFLFLRESLNNKIYDSFLFSCILNLKSIAVDRYL